jgi:hypothetical protein
MNKNDAFPKPRPSKTTQFGCQMALPHSQQVKLRHFRTKPTCSHLFVRAMLPCVAKSGEKLDLSSWHRRFSWACCPLTVVLYCCSVVYWTTQTIRVDNETLSFKAKLSVLTILKVNTDLWQHKATSKVCLEWIDHERELWLMLNKHRRTTSPGISPLLHEEAVQQIKMRWRSNKSG